MGNLSTGSLGYFSYELEATKGTPAARSHYLMLNSNNIEAAPDVLKKSVMAASRQAERVVKTVKFAVAGTIGHDLFPTQGAQMIMAALGQDTYLTALTADATSAVATTANGLTTLTLANAATSRTYTKGAWITYGPNDKTQILRQIVKIVSGNGTTGTVIQVRDIGTAVTASGTAVAQVGQHMFSPIPASSVDVSTLPTLTLEMNEAQKYAWLLAGSYVSKYNMKGSKETVEITETIAATTLPKRLDRSGGNAWTAWNPTTNEMADATRPFTINDGFVIVPGDPGTSGTSTLQAMNTLEDWELDLDNGLIAQDFWNGTRVKDYTPGNSKSMFRYTYAMQSDRPVEFEDYLNQPYNTPTPAFVSLSTDISGPAASTPTWNAVGISIPNTLITKAPTTRATGAVLSVSVESDVLIGGSGEDPLDIFVVNNVVTAYTGA